MAVALALAVVFAAAFLALAGAFLAVALALAVVFAAAFLALAGAFLAVALALAVVFAAAFLALVVVFLAFDATFAKTINFFAVAILTPAFPNPDSPAFPIPARDLIFADTSFVAVLLPTPGNSINFAIAFSLIPEDFLAAMVSPQYAGERV